MTPFSKKLVSTRKKTGKTQEIVAKVLGKSRPAIANWERGRSVPDLFTFAKWCKLMGTTPNDMLGF